MRSAKRILGIPQFSGLPPSLQGVPIPNSDTFATRTAIFPVNCPEAVVARRKEGARNRTTVPAETRPHGPFALPWPANVKLPPASGGHLGNEPTMGRRARSPTLAVGGFRLIGRPVPARQRLQATGSSWIIGARFVPTTIGRMPQPRRPPPPDLWLPRCFGCVERTPHVLDRGATGSGRPSHRHDVKTSRRVEQVMSFEINQGEPRQLPLLVDVDGLRRSSVSVIRAGLNFHKYDGVTVGCDQVNLASLNGYILLDDFEPPSPQVSPRSSLPTCPQG